MAWACSSPVRAKSTNVLKITDGGGTRRPFDHPKRTAISQTIARPTGSKRLSAGRTQRAADLLLGAAACAGVVSIDAVIRERDIARRRNAMTDVPRAHRSNRRMGRALARPVDDVSSRKADDGFR